MARGEIRRPCIYRSRRRVKRVVTAPSMLTPAAELLRRCSAVHHFDAALVEVLCEAPPAVAGVGLADLIAAGAVEPVPGRPGRFQLPELARHELYASWWDGEPPAGAVPAGLRALSERVLAHLAVRPGAAGEALFHQLIVAPGTALAAFQAAFREADAAFDLARCQDLLDVVLERRALLGPDGEAICDACQRRLRGRALWLGDWRRSERYLVPRACAGATDALLGGQVRALELRAESGMGKSSFLRWLIARRCVPAGIACARVDFEAVDPLRAAREPWLVVLELAAQLDRQLPGASLGALLADYPGQRERLLRKPTRAPCLGAAAVDVPARFATALRALDGPIVIALDSVERALEPAAWLARVVGDVEPVRLVVAGREPLRVDGARPLRLGGFSRAEARRYLRDRRGLDDAALVERLVTGAGGMPFRLELLADVAGDEHAVEPATDLAGVMAQVLRPLDPDLAALLRLGVAPRTLEHDFAVAVLAPLLPGRDLDALWRALRHYASSASWVQLDPVDVGAVRFHPAVLEPMRELLRGRDDHAELQRRAAAWFQARAAADPANATRWLCEAVFHRFQLDPVSAIAHWESAIAAARSERRPDRRRALAAEVLRTPVPEPVALRARWHHAVATVQLAHRERTPDVAAAERAAASISGAPLRRAEAALVEAGAALVRGDVVAARPHVERALHGPLAREDALWLRLAYAAALPAGDPRHAAAHFRSSLAFARRGHAWDVAAVHLQLAVRCEALDQLDRALAACDAAAPLACPRQAVEVALLRARAELRRGAPSLAVAVIDAVPGEEPDVQARCAILRVRALLAAGEPRRALAVADETAAWFSADLRRAGDRHWAIAAEGRELRGTVNARLLDLPRALADFDEAAERWRRLGATDAVARCRLRAAALHLRAAEAGGDENGADRFGIGAGADRHAAAAAVRLAAVRPEQLEPGTAVWARHRLVEAALDPARGAGLAREALDGLRAAGAAPRVLIAVALAGLARTAGAAQDPLVNTLCAQLSRVTPAPARLAVLDGFEPGPLTGSRVLRNRLRRLVPSPVRHPQRFADLPEADRRRLVALDAELDRIAGRLKRT